LFLGGSSLAVLSLAQMDLFHGVPNSLVPGMVTKANRLLTEGTSVFRTPGVDSSSYLAVSDTDPNSQPQAQCAGFLWKNNLSVFEL
jgi:hypothetical protein